MKEYATGVKMYLRVAVSEDLERSRYKFSVLSSAGAFGEFARESHTGAVR